MTTGVAAALLAALGWTLASGLWRRVPTSLGAAQLNLLKNLLALTLQLPLLVVLLERAAMAPLPLSLLLASGALGIAAGDSFYFAALRRLGTRRTLTFEAGGPAVTGAAGLVLLAEVPRAHQWAGILLVSLALVLVARQQAPQPPDAAAAADRGQPGLPQLGVLLALLALQRLPAGLAVALLATAPLMAVPLAPLEGDRPGPAGWLAAALGVLGVGLLVR